MPELAEVEYVARQLRGSIIGARITAVAVLWPRAVTHPDPATFIAEIVGCSITAIERRAKVLLVALSGDQVLTIHRRMSGNLTLLSPHEPDEPYIRVAFDLDTGQRLIFTDPRKFGRLELWSRAEMATVLAHFGPEPLEPDFTPARLATILGVSQRAIKALLLDQNAIAGLGNIYADESLFRAGIHPLRPAASLNTDEIERLHHAIITALEIGIEHGGTTFGRHRDLFGTAGTNLDHILVYQHTGQPCVSCGTPITKITVAQRGTHFCPRCQPPPTPPLSSNDTAPTLKSSGEP